MRNLLAAMTVAALALAAPAAQAETLADALISAYRASNLMAQNEAVLRAADEDVAVAVSALRPVVEYTAQSAYVRSQYNSFSPIPPFEPTMPYVESLTNSIILSASMMLYDWGRTDLSIQVAQESVLATGQALVNVEQQVLMDAVAAYVDMGLETEIVAMQESNMRLITQDLRATKDRFDVGEVTRTDVALAEARLASANAQLAAAQGQYNLARERYRAAIGHYPSNMRGLPRPPITARTLDEARAIALRSHPVMLQAQHQARAADLRVELAKAQMQPTLSGRVQVGESSTDGADLLGNQQVVLSYKQTIYAGGQLSALYRKALAGQDAARAALHQTGVNVDENVGRAWSGILVASASINAGQEQIRAAQAAYDGVKEEADLGSRTTLDVLDAEQELLNAKAAKLQAVANSYIGQYQLLSAMGLLTADHLKLGIPTYDPNAYYNAVKNAPATSAQGARLDRILKTIGN